MFLCLLLMLIFKSYILLFGTDSDQNGMLEEIPRSGTDSYRWLSHLGVRAPYATRRKCRYEANQVWLNTTFISQVSQSWGKLAVETWRVKTELIITTILHIIIITTSILNLGFKTIAPKIFFLFFVYFFGGLECVGHPFAYVAHLWFLRDVWIWTQSAAVASWRATDLATHPPKT